MQRSMQDKGWTEFVGFIRPIWQRRKAVVRVWLTFVVSLAVLIQILVWARPFTDGPLAIWIAKLSAAILRGLGVEASSNGALVTSSLGTVEIIRECTGVYPTALFIAAVLAYPCAWSRKLWGILLGVGVVQVVNLVRIVSLCYVLKKFPEVFETAHLLVWQSAVAFLTMLTWLVWAVEFSGVRPSGVAKRE